MTNCNEVCRLSAERVCVKTVLAIVLSACALVFLANHGALAQVAAPPPPVIPNPSDGATLRTFFTNRTPYEFWLTCLIGIVALSIVGALIWAVGRTHNPKPEDVTRPVIVIAVIFSTLILVTAGYSNDQIAPAFGLFGTIVGYLLGRAGPMGAPAAADGTAAQPAPGATQTPPVVDPMKTDAARPAVIADTGVPQARSVP